MAKLILSDVSNILGNPTTAATTINANNDAIEAALENTLSRDGTTPNQMAADLDMNNNDVLNVATIAATDFTIAGSSVTAAVQQAVDAAIVAEAARDDAVAAAAAFRVATRAELKALDTTTARTAYLTESPREGMFIWKTGDYSTQIAADTLEGIYIKADAIAATAGAWVRVYDGKVETMWFGAVADGVTDDQPKISAAITLVATIFGGGVVHLGRIGNSSTVYAVGASVSILDDVYVEGDGDGATEVKALGDYPVFTNIGTISAGRSRGGISNLTIRGGGKANVSAHGVVMEWSNRFRLKNLRFFGCRDAIQYHDVWQVWIDKISVDGAGTDQNYNGLHATGHDATNPNNAVIASNIVVQNVANVGYRLQYFNGSKFVNCEVAGAGSHGWHLGAPDVNTGPVEWGHFSNCLSDTTVGDCFRIEKGGADDVKQFQINGLWLGTSTGGDGLSIFDASLFEVTGLKVANIYKSAVRLTRCSRATITGWSADSFDRQNAANPAIALIDTGYFGIAAGSAYASDRPSSKGFIESQVSGTTDYNRLSDNDFGNHGGTRLGVHTIVKGCTGYKTRSSGTADVAVATSSTTVAHGLAETPANGDIHITPRFDINAGGVARYWVDNLTATTFRINVNTAVVTNTIAFSWVADVTRG